MMTLRVIILALSATILLMATPVFDKLSDMYEADKSPNKDHMEYCGIVFLYMFLCTIAIGAIFLFGLDVISGG